MPEPAHPLQERGYRLTPQRAMVWDVLLAGGGHLTAEQIHEGIAQRWPRVNISTVYRTLDLLVAEGLVREAPLGGDRRVYEAAGRDAGDHHHLVCLGCGLVEHIAAAHTGQLEAHLEAEHGFRSERVALTSYGRCRHCRPRRRK